MKTYANKSNAARAAKAANAGTLENLELKGKEGEWYYAPVKSAGRNEIADGKAKKVRKPAAEPAPEVTEMFAKLDAAKARLATPSKPEAKAKAPKAPREKKTGTYADMQANRSNTSAIENPVRAMWDLCDSMTGSKRKDVIQAAVDKGINYYTARTQYQLWLTAWRNSQPQN